MQNHHIGLNASPNRGENSSNVTRVVLVGCGGLALEASQYIADNNDFLATVDKEVIVTDILSADSARFDEICIQLHSKPELCSDVSDISELETKHFIICIGDALVRRRFKNELSMIGAQFANVIHHSAYIAPTSKIGRGVIIAPFAFVGPFAKIGDNCVLNVRSTVGHDAILGDSAILSPHVDINGSAVVGEGCFFGACAVVDPAIEIGSFCKVASGTVVKQNAGDGFLIVGNPGKGRQMFQIPA